MMLNRGSIAKETTSLISSSKRTTRSSLRGWPRCGIKNFRQARDRKILSRGPRGCTQTGSKGRPRLPWNAENYKRKRTDWRRWHSKHLAMDRNLNEQLLQVDSHLTQARGCLRSTASTNFTQTAKNAQRSRKPFEIRSIRSRVTHSDRRLTFYQLAYHQRHKRY